MYQGKEIVIEFWGIDEKNPIEFDPHIFRVTVKEYIEMMGQKREFWKERHPEVIFLQLSMADLDRSFKERIRFEEILKASLVEVGLKIAKLPEEVIQSRLKEHVISHMTKLFVQFIQRAKQNCWSVEETKIKVLSFRTSSPKEKAFLQLGCQVYQAYEEAKNSDEWVDFYDLLSLSIQKIEKEQGNCWVSLGYNNPKERVSLNDLQWLLIDEYQDFSLLFFRLIESIRKYNPQMKLLCVGDDWQAINGFAGSDLRFFADFDSFFPGSGKGYLQYNHRSLHKIVELGNALMSPEQPGGKASPGHPSAAAGRSCRWCRRRALLGRAGARLRRVRPRGRGRLLGRSGPRASSAWSRRATSCACRRRSPTSRRASPGAARAARRLPARDPLPGDARTDAALGRERAPLDLSATNERCSPSRAAPLPTWARRRAWSSAAAPGAPRRLPLVGRGDERLDLRIVAVDALDRSFWPFPDHPVEVDESARPPGPGDRAGRPTRPSTRRSRRSAAASRALGSPPSRRWSTCRCAATAAGPRSASISRRISTASRDRRRGHLSRRHPPGDGADAGRRRSWLRLQVTDLALSTLEEPGAHGLRRDLAGDRASARGRRGHGRGRVRRGGTDLAGRRSSTAPPTRAAATWAAPGVKMPCDGRSSGSSSTPATTRSSSTRSVPRRLRGQPLEGVRRELAAVDPGGARRARRAAAGPGAPLRRAAGLPPGGAGPPQGLPAPALPGAPRGARRSRVPVVEGPGDLVWRYPVTLADNGSFYWKFDEKDLPTGTYRAHFEFPDERTRALGTASFRKEAYRLPQFEVRLAGPERAPLDRRSTSV